MSVWGGYNRPVISLLFISGYKLERRQRKKIIKEWILFGFDLDFIWIEIIVLIYFF